MAIDRGLEARLKAIEARLQMLEDDRAIRELLARYGFNADYGRAKEYVDLYTEDGVMNLGTIVTRGVGYEGIQRWEGKRQLMEFITDPRAHKAIEGRCMHVQGNNLVTYIKGNEAVAESYSIVLLREENDTIVRSAGFNHWTLRKVNSKWLIKERKRRAIGGEEYREVITATKA